MDIPGWDISRETSVCDPQTRVRGAVCSGPNVPEAVHPSMALLCGQRSGWGREGAPGARAQPSSAAVAPLMVMHSPGGGFCPSSDPSTGKQGEQTLRRPREAQTLLLLLARAKLPSQHEVMGGDRLPKGAHQGSGGCCHGAHCRGEWLHPARPRCRRCCHFVLPLDRNVPAEVATSEMQTEAWAQESSATL